MDYIIKLSAFVAAVFALLGVLSAAHKWYLRQAKQDKDIERLNEENALIVYALSACLDGLQQLGANHTVPDAKNKLDKYINQQAHRND